MHEIDRRVRLQQVPPGPLARIGLARHQQHPQPVAHAVDRDDRRVVAVGQLARDRAASTICSTLTPPRCSVTGSVDAAVDRHVEAQRLGAVERDRERHVAAAGRRRAQILDPERQAHRLVDDGEGRRGLDHDPAVPVVGAGRSAAPAPGRESASSASASCTWPSVTRIAPAIRSAGSSAVASASAVRSSVPVLAAVGHVHDAHLEPAASGRAAPGAPRSPSSAACDCAPRSAMRLQALSSTTTRRDARHRRCDPPAAARARRAPPAAPARPARAATSRSARARARATTPTSATPPARRSAAAAAADRRRPPACYCPSRSSSAGTCTWSDL